MLTNSVLQRDHRIKLYLLIAACLEDEVEADDLVERAESQWRMARSFSPKTGEDPDSEEALGELRGEIDAVKQQFHGERAAAWAQDEQEMEGIEMAAEGGGGGEVAPRGKMDEEGAAPLCHHRHKPGSVRRKQQASRASTLPARSSPATFQPFRSPAVVPKVKKEEESPMKKEVESPVKDESSPADK